MKYKKVMKIVSVSLCALIMSFSAPLFASGDHHDEGKGHHEHKVGDKIMSMDQMHTQMKNLKGLMEKIHNTKDAKALQKLMNTNMDTLMKGMELMDAMMIMMMNRK